MSEKELELEDRDYEVYELITKIRQLETFVPNWFAKSHMVAITKSEISDEEWATFRDCTHIRDAIADATSELMAEWWAAWKDPTNGWQPDAEPDAEPDADD